MDVEHLTALLREAEQHHGDYEPTAPPHHWSTWYAGYIVARDEGKSSEEAVTVATQHTEGGPFDPQGGEMASSDHGDDPGGA